MFKIIVYGYTDLGFKIANMLRQSNYKVEIVDYEDEKIQKAKIDGYITHKSELLKDDDLIKLGINTSIEAIFCVSDSPNNNFFVSLSVRNLNKNIKIISKAVNAQNEKKMYLAGANTVINPYEIGALKIFRTLEKPFLSAFINEIVQEHNMLTEEFVIQKDTVLDGRFLDEFYMGKIFDIVIIGILDKELGDGFIFNYHSQRHKIDAGDVLVVMGHSEELKKFSKFLERSA